MKAICCHGCVAPKRHPGCHDHCPEYIKEKAQHNAEKAEEDKRKRIEYGIISQLKSGIRRANMINHKKG